MPAPHSFAAKSPIPVYTVALPRADVLVYAGGGGQSRSGVANAIRSVSVDVKGSTLSDRGERKLSVEEDAPMCMAIAEGGGGGGDIKGSKGKIVVGINAAVDPSGANENLRLFDWTTTGKEKASSASERAREASTSVAGAQSDVIEASAKAASVEITDAEVYIKRIALSPNGKILAVGSTDGQIALHSFPSLDILWKGTPPSPSSSSGGGSTPDVVDVTFSADSALVAFVTPTAIFIYPTSEVARSNDKDSRKAPELYQSIRNPTLKGTTGCVFRAARFGRNGEGVRDIKSSRLYTVVNTNPPAGLGSSKKDREKAKVRKCFVSVWDADQWTLLQTRQISERPATVAELSDNGKFFAVTTSDLSIHLLSAQSLRTIWQINDAHAFPGTCLAFSPHADVLVSGSADMSLRIAQVGDRQEPAVTTVLLEGKVATAIIAILLALLAWYLQQYLSLDSHAVPTPSPTMSMPVPEL